MRTEKPDLNDALGKAEEVLEGPDPDRLDTAVAVVAGALDDSLYDGVREILAERLEILRAAARKGVEASVAGAYLEPERGIELRWFGPGAAGREDATAAWNAMVSAFALALSVLGQH